MTDLFLIAHKVRGEPAFDVASRVACAVCHDGQRSDGCAECDSTGFWWIVPTSGHRAYPWWHKQFSRISCEGWLAIVDDPWRDVPVMPPTLPDHYTSRAATVVPTGLAALLAKRKPLNVERRGR